MSLLWALLRLRRAAHRLVRQRAARDGGVLARRSAARSRRSTGRWWSCNFVIPFVDSRRSGGSGRSPAASSRRSAWSIGMWLERFLIIVPSLGAQVPAVQLGHLPPAAGRDHHHGRDVRRDGAALRAVLQVRADHLDLGDEGGQQRSAIPSRSPRPMSDVAERGSRPAGGRAHEGRLRPLHRSARAQQAVNGLRAAGVADARHHVISAEPIEEYEFGQRDKATWM